MKYFLSNDSTNNLSKKQKCTIKVSVIIPFYNSKRYLNETISSILSQTLRDIEVIFINDGSTDGSEEIVKEYQKNDARIRFLEQPHMNAGAARNLGLKNARGKYVIFWDADDLFDKNALKHMYRKAEKTSSDICICEVLDFDSKGRCYEVDGYLRTDLLPKKDPFCKYDIPDHIFNISSNVVWNKLFLREFIMDNGIRFQSIAQANDTAFTMLAMYHAKRITCVKKRLIFYRLDGENSLTNNATKTTFCPYEAFMFTSKKLKEEKEFATFQKSFLNKAAKGMFRVLDTQKIFQTYYDLYVFLQKEGLQNLELSSCKKEDFEELWMYQSIENIKKLSAEDFLIYKTNERKKDRDRLRYRMGKIRRQLKPFVILNQILKKLNRRFYIWIV